jgi:hypothetical protein
LLLVGICLDITDFTGFGDDLAGDVTAFMGVLTLGAVTILTSFFSAAADPLGTLFNLPALAFALAGSVFVLTIFFLLLF